MITRILGFVFLGLTVVIWVSSGFLLQDVQVSFNFQEPFFLTYFSTTIFNLYFIEVLRKIPQIKSSEIPPPRNHFKLALLIFPFYFSANYFYNYSLINTSVSSVTILSCSSGSMTYLLSIIFLKEKIEILKLVALIFSLAGIISISLTNAEYNNASIIGNIMALLSALIYSIYCLILSKNSKTMYIPHMYAFLGLINLLGMIPLLIIFNYTNIEPFEIPQVKVISLLLLNALVSTLFSELIWAYSIKFLNPTICTFGSSLTIPLSLTVEVILYHYSFSPLYIVGALFIIVSFFIISLFEHPTYGHLFTNENLKVRLCRKKLKYRDGNRNNEIMLSCSK